MNYSTAILLVRPDCRVIQGIYETIDDKGNDANGKAVKKSLFKTFDTTIKKDDLLIVPSFTRLHVTTIKVTETDIEWDPDTTESILWVIGKIDLAAFTDMVRMEDNAISAIKESEKTYKRDEMKKKMFAHMNPEQIEKLSAPALPTPTT